MIAVSELVAAYAQEMRTIRRQLHQIPEEGYREEKTQSYLMEQLSGLGVDKLEVFASTGLRAVIYAREPKGTIAFRADIDALCIKEENTHGFVSRHKGFMHACGHDGHMTMLLGLARLCMEHHGQLQYNVVLIFQPAEESVGGAKRMIEEGILENPKVDRLYGFHIMPDIPEGMIGLRAGALMAQTCEFDIEILGKSAHGAMPHKGIDTVAIGCEFYNAFQTILTRTIDPYEHALVTIGKIQAGTRRNIIADRLVMEGTIRTFSEDVFNALKNNIIKKLHAIASCAGASAKFTEIVTYPCVENPEALTKEMVTLAGEENVVRVEPYMIAEDFSFYQRAVPALFTFLGSKKTGALNAPLHSCYFDFDETILAVGLEIYSRILGFGGKEGANGELV